MTTTAHVRVSDADAGACVAPDRAPAAPPRSPPRSGRWIVSAGQDLIWFQGSVLAGVALLIFFRMVPGQAALWGLLLWGILFDGTHVVGTYARSYLAPDREAHAGLPGAWSLVLLGIGPAIAIIDASTGGPLFQYFLLAAFLWAYFHLVRQHWGFVTLYRRRAPHGQDPTPARLDEAVLWLGCLYPFVRFALSPAYASSGLPNLLPEAAREVALVVLDGGAALAAVALTILWLVRPRAPLGPKHTLVAIVIGFHVAVFALLDDLLQITATLTIFHNLQYHRIVWQHESGKGRRPLDGLAPYLLVGVALGIVWYGPRVLGAGLAGPGLLRNVLLGLGWGIAFHHYLVDGRIWRVRRSPALARAIDAGAAP